MNTQEKDPLIDENDNVSLRAIVESYDRLTRSERSLTEFERCRKSSCGSHVSKVGGRRLFGHLRLALGGTISPRCLVLDEEAQEPGARCPSSA